MNRIIKFRAWSLHNKEMYQDNSPCPAAYSFQIYGNGNIGYCPTFSNDDLMSFYTDTDPENEKFKIVVMQFTGLQDKNGKDIYEADIVKWGHIEGGEEKPIRIAEVKINPDIQFRCVSEVVEHTYRYGQFIYKDTHIWLEIIGNIYQHPELLTPPQTTVKQ